MHMQLLLELYVRDLEGGPMSNFIVINVVLSYIWHNNTHNVTQLFPRNSSMFTSLINTRFSPARALGATFDCGSVLEACENVVLMRRIMKRLKRVAVFEALCGELMCTTIKSLLHPSFTNSNYTISHFQGSNWFHWHIAFRMRAYN